MNKSLVLTLTLTTAVLGGCGKAALLKMPAVPQEKSETVDATISFGSDTQPEATQFEKHIIESGSSIVINVPNEEMKRRAAMQQKSEDFQTDDFFNEAEQEIEKGLIGRGFRVLSRAKFEAKLRKLRDEAQHGEWDDELPSEARAIINKLEKENKAGLISDAELLDRTQKIRTTYRDEDPGQSRRGEQELTDIAEVIRAAQEGDVRADYILQINLFNTNKRLTAYSDLRKNTDIREFMQRYPSLRGQMKAEENHLLNCKISGAEFNAKLIEVATGSIVWIGNFEANELDSGIEKISIEMGQRTHVTNANDVRRFINYNNSDDQRKRRKKREVQIPEWKYTTDLIPYMITAGTCNTSWKLNRQNASKLTRRVARDLIKTIKVQ